MPSQPHPDRRRDTPPTGRRVRSYPQGRVAALSMALTIAWSPSPSQGDLYRWVDETGTTVYSQSPPPGATATTIKPDKAPSADQSRQAVEQLRGRVEQDFDQRDDQARAAEEAGKKAVEEAARKANCAAASKNLDTLRNHGQGRLRTPDGKSTYLSKDGLAKKMDEAREQIKASCN